MARTLWRMIAAAVGLAGSIAAADAQQQERRYTIGTNPPGTLYHTVGSGFAKVLQDKLQKQTIVQPAAGSSVYLPLIQNREMTMGISSSLDSGGGYRGEQGRAPMADLRTLARLWPLSYGYMARANSGIRTMADLKGKRVVVDIRGNAALGEANVALLASAGLARTDVAAVPIGDLPQGIQGVIDGTIDATALALGIPLAKQAHASVSGGIVYLNLIGPNGTTEFLNEKLSGLYALKIKPSPAMPEVTEEITVGGFDIFLIASAKLSDADTQAIVRTLSDNWSELQKDFPALRAARAEEFAAPTNTVPYHPAAVAYFRDKKLWSEANDQRERSLSR